MTDLQIILLISSGAFLAGLYWWSKRTKEQNTLKPHKLKQHGFRAETPEEEGLEVRLSSRSNKHAQTPVTPKPQVSAREAWERATAQADKANVSFEQSSPTVPQERHVEKTFNRQAESHSYHSPAQEAMEVKATDPYLEERFALGEPVIPRATQQQPSRGQGGYQSPLRDHDNHHIGEQTFHMEHEDRYQKDQPRMEQHHDYHSISDHYDESPRYAEPRMDHYGHHGYAPDYVEDHEPHFDHYEEPEPSLPSQIFALLVIDPHKSFSRRDIHNVMLNAGLVFSTSGVYVYYDKSNNYSHYIFRVANMSDSGYFPEVDDQPEEFSTSGVALVLELPAVVTPFRAMNDFITAARRISQNLGGNLYDANRRLIKESHLKEMREYAQSIT